MVLLVCLLTKKFWRDTKMLDKIYEFGLKNCEKILPSCYQQKTIGGYIHIDKTGKYLFFEVIEKPEISIVPAISNSGSSKTNVLLEKLEIIINLDTAPNREKYYMQKINECASHSSEFLPVLSFLNLVRSDNVLRDKIKDEFSSAPLKKNFISFKVDGKKIEENEKVRSVLENIVAEKDTTTMYGISSITNTLKELCTDSVKFKFKDAGYDVSIMPFSQSQSAESYFQSGAEISRIGKDEVNVIKIALEKLLNDPNHHNSFFRMSFWYDDSNSQNLVKKELFNFLNFSDIETEKKENDDCDNNGINNKLNNNASKSLKAIEKVDDSKIGNVKDEWYYTFFCYSPCNGRYRMYGYRQWNIATVIRNLLQFKKDATILYNKKESTIENLNSLLYNLVATDIRDKQKYIKDIFGQNIDKLIYAIYNGDNIPSIFYNVAIKIATHYISVDSLNKDRQRYELRHYLNALKIIKLYNIRKENSMGNTAYQCGRIFAIYELLQRNITGGDSVTRMYSMAMHNPLIVFNKLSAQSKYYLTSSKMSSGGRIYYEKMLNELYENIKIPSKFSHQEQGDFILGYHSQQNILFTKKETTNNE